MQIRKQNRCNVSTLSVSVCSRRLLMRQGKLNRSRLTKEKRCMIIKLMNTPLIRTCLAVVHQRISIQFSNYLLFQKNPNGIKNANPDRRPTYEEEEEVNHNNKVNIINGKTELIVFVLYCFISTEGVLRRPTTNDNQSHPSHPGRHIALNELNTHKIDLSQPSMT